MELGIWIQDEKGFQYIVTKRSIRALTPGFEIPDRVHHVVEQLYREALGRYPFPPEADMRRVADEAIDALYTVLKEQLP